MSFAFLFYFRKIARQKLCAYKNIKTDILIAQNAKNLPVFHLTLKMRISFVLRFSILENAVFHWILVKISMLNATKRRRTRNLLRHMLAALGKPCGSRLILPFGGQKHISKPRLVGQSGDKSALFVIPAHKSPYVIGSERLRKADIVPRGPSSPLSSCDICGIMPPPG